MITTSHLILFVITLVVNVSLAKPLIFFLQKHHFYKTKSTKGVDVSQRNPLWYRFFGKTLGTPSSFGILLLVNYFLLLVLTKEIILVIWLILFLLLGLYDDYYKYAKYLTTNHWGLKPFHKFILQSLLVISFLYFQDRANNLTLIFTFLVLIFSINSYNITDGLDSLIASLTLISLPFFYYFELHTHANNNVLSIIGSVFSFFIVFLFLNKKPAQVYLGDSGALSIGMLFGFLFLRYPLILTLPMLTIIFIEGLSSLIQIFSRKFLNKKVFIIAPLHLHLLNKGWSDVKIVTVFSSIQLVLCLLSLFIFKRIITS